MTASRDASTAPFELISKLTYRLLRTFKHIKRHISLSFKTVCSRPSPTKSLCSVIILMQVIISYIWDENSPPFSSLAAAVQAENSTKGVESPPNTKTIEYKTSEDNMTAFHSNKFIVSQSARTEPLLEIKLQSNYHIKIYPYYLTTVSL